MKEEDSCTEEIRFLKAANLGEAAYFTQEVGMIFELLLNAYLSRVKGRIAILIVRFARSAARSNSVR